MKLLPLVAGLLAAAPGYSQVITDGSLGPRTSIPPPYTIPSTLGTLARTNLFHSFQVFNIGAGQTALFTAPPFVSNIIGRITGGHATTILGTVRSTLEGTSLYLINPNGVIFGPNAVVDVNGSFYASTAQYVRFGDGSRFESRIAPGVTLSVEAPTGFEFDSRYVAPISVINSTVRVREGATAGFVGGGIAMGGSATGTTSIQARGGNVIIAAVAGPGVVDLGAHGATLTGFDALADVVIGRGTDINANEGTLHRGGGTVFMRGNNISMDQAQVRASTAFADAGGMDIVASRDLNIRHSNVVSVTTGAGNAGTIRIAGRNVTVADTALVDTSCDPGCTTGNGGRLEVRATDVFYIDGRTGADPTFVVSNSFGRGSTGQIDVTAGTMVLDGSAYLQGVATAQGDASHVAIHTGNIVLRNGGQVDSSTRGAGRGGQVVVDNSGSIVVQGTRADSAQNGLILPSGFFSNTEGAGDAGGIVVNTRSLEVIGGGELSSSARRGSSGQGGSIAVSATDSIRISGADGSGKASGIVTNTFATGDAGEITLSAPLTEISADGKVQSQSEGKGRAGRIHVAGRDLTLSSRGQISSDARASGNAGNIDVSLTGTLAISGSNSGIFAKTYGPAHGGGIAIGAARVVLNDGGGIFATTDGSGDAGTIALDASESITLTNKARIASETSSSGAAGNLDIRSAGALTLSDEAQITTSSGLGGGVAGSVSLHAGGNITMSRNARIASESQSSGFAGNLAIRADGTLQISSGGRITTSALFSDGGNILIDVPLGVTMANGTVATAVSRGLGDGGNITLKTNLLLMRDSIVSANAFGGNGGNVSIGAVNLFSNPATKVTASSQLGIDGTVVFQSPAIDLSGALLSLPTGFLDVSAIAAGRCGARLASGSSSLVVRRFDASEALRNGFRMSSAGGTSEGALAADLALCEPRDIAPSFVAAR